MALRALVFLATLSLLTSWGYAQKAIQLPTFSFTTVNTTVTAPDGGTVLLGGINRLAEGSTERGVPLLGKVPGLGRLFRNKGIGRNVSASTMTVVPRIIILEEEEEKQVGRVLAARRAGAAAPVPPLGAVNDLYRRRAAYLKEVAAQKALPDYRREEPLAQADPYAKVEDVRRKNEIAAQTRSREAVDYYERGQSAEAEGKDGAARVYYAMAAKRAKGQFKEEIETRLDALNK
jgi:hypothetical protein